VQSQLFLRFSAKGTREGATRMIWEVKRWGETKHISYGHLVGEDYPLTVRTLYEALGTALHSGSISDNAELVVNRPLSDAHDAVFGDAGEVVKQEHLVRRLEVVFERVDTMQGLTEGNDSDGNG